MAGVRGVAVVRRVRDMRERHAKGAFHRVTTQHGLSVHGIEVVDPVQDRRLQATIAERAGDDVEGHRAAQRTDVDGAGGCLAVADDLRARDARRELVSPVHETLASRLADRDDRVDDGAGGRQYGDLVSLAPTHQGSADR